jgi:hypothetical protein
MNEPYQGHVYDPAMGSGGFIVQSKRFVESRAEEERPHDSGTRKASGRRGGGAGGFSGGGLAGALGGGGGIKEGRIVSGRVRCASISIRPDHEWSRGERFMDFPWASAIGYRRSLGKMPCWGERIERRLNP